MINDDCNRNSFYIKERVSNLKWNVYYYDFTQNQIKILNIFNHSRFVDDICKNLKKNLEKEKFIVQLRNDLFYYFGAKVEYEVVISSLSFGTRNTDERKVDVFEQVINNWDIFVNYVWDVK